LKIGRHKIKLLIFDMDGLMFDTERLAIIYWKEVGKKFNYKIDDSIFKQTIGLKLTETEEVFKKHYGAGFPFEEIKNEKIRLTENYVLSKGVPLKGGLCELLEYIKTRLLKMALATSAEKSRMEMLLNLSNTKKYFDAVTCGDEVVNGKPDPEIFIKTSQKINCSPGACMVLEDSKNGIIVAYRAGMLPVMIPDMNEPEKEIEAVLFKKFTSLIEVRDYIKNNLEV